MKKFDEHNLPPEMLEMEMQLDLLADGELPESERRSLLLSLDRTPERWRDVALRFLQRQTERSTVRQLISGAASLADDVPANYPFHRRLTPVWLNIRSAAAILIMATGCSVVTGYLARRSAELPALSSVSVELPSTLTGDTNPSAAVNVPLVADYGLPKMSPYLNVSAESLPHHVVIMPQGHDRAVVFPVTTVARNQTIY